jgi:hypothetical protein
VNGQHLIAISQLSSCNEITVIEHASWISLHRSTVIPIRCGTARGGIPSRKSF